MATLENPEIDLLDANEMNSPAPRAWSRSFVFWLRRAIFAPAARAGRRRWRTSLDAEAAEKALGVGKVRDNVMAAGRLRLKH